MTPAKSNDRARLRNAGIALLGGTAALMGILVLMARTAYSGRSDVLSALSSDLLQRPALFWLVAAGPLVAALITASVAAIALRSRTFTTSVRQALWAPLIAVCGILVVNLVVARSIGLVVLVVPFVLYSAYVAWTRSRRM